MPIRYLNMTGRVNDSNTVRLPNDFTQSTKDKYFIIKGYTSHLNIIKINNCYLV